MNEGGLVIIDDLDALIHPLLLKHIILLFEDKRTNPYGAPLLFASHDAAAYEKTPYFVVIKSTFWLAS